VVAPPPRFNNAPPKYFFPKTTLAISFNPKDNGADQNPRKAQEKPPSGHQSLLDRHPGSFAEISHNAATCLIYLRKNLAIFNKTQETFPARCHPNHPQRSGLPVTFFATCCTPFACRASPPVVIFTPAVA